MWKVPLLIPACVLPCPCIFCREQTSRFLTPCPTMGLCSSAIASPAESRVHSCPVHHLFCPGAADTAGWSHWHGPQPLMPLCAAFPHSIPAAPGTEPGYHFPSCSAPRRPGQRCIYVMLHKQGYLNKQCEHNICYPTLPIVFTQSFNQQSSPPEFKLM